MEQSTYKPTMEDERVISSTLDTMRSYAEQTRDLRKEWDEIRMAWNLVPQKKYTNKSNIVVPMLRDAVEIVLPRIYSKHPTILGSPVDDTADVPLAEFMSKLLDFQWQHTMRANRATRKTVKSAILYGVGIGKLYWKYDEKQFKQKKRFLKFIPYTKKGKTILYDDPCYEPRSIFNIFMDPQAPTLQDSAMVIEKFTMNLSTLKRMKGYKNLQHVRGSKSYEETSDHSLYDQSIVNDREFQTSTYKRPGTVEIIEAWTDDEVITIADYNTSTPVLIRHMPNPYMHGKKPFYVMHAFEDPEPNRIYTPGLGKVLLGLQDAQSTVVNQLINNINLNIKKAFTVKRSANLKQADLDITPGKGIRVNNHDDLKELRIDDMSEGVKFILSFINQSVESASGATDIAKGLSSGDTATSDHIKNQNLETRIELLRRNFEDFISDIGQDMVSLNQQYIKQSKTIKIFDNAKQEERLIRFSPKQIQNGKFDITVEADSSVAVDRQTRTKRMLEFYDRFSKDEAVKLNTRELAKELAKNEGLPTEKLFMDVQPASMELMGAIKAEDENRQMLAGKQMPPYEKADMAHIEHHMKYKYDPIVAAHIEAEMDLVESRNPEPDAPPEQAPVAQPTEGSYQGQVQSNYAPINNIQ